MYKHASQELGCEMKFTVYMPPASGPVPVRPPLLHAPYTNKRVCELPYMTVLTVLSHVLCRTSRGANVEIETVLQVILYLSGLTCTNENFIVKAGAQRCAAELGIALVSADTSPRGLGIEGEDESYDFGSGTPAHQIAAKR